MWKSGVADDVYNVKRGYRKDTSFHALQAQVEQHVAAAETGLFPLAQDVLATHLEEIAVLLQERKAQLLAS